jgi:glycosyltransferase involved in cell wall biosynthesis
MIKIIYIVTDLPTGGAEVMLYQLLSKIDRTRFAPAVISLRDRGTLGDRIEALGIPVHALQITSGIPTPAALWRLLRLVRQLQPDILQGWMYHGNLAAQLASLACPGKVPVLWDIQCSLYSLALEKKTTAMVIQACAQMSQRPEKVVYVSQVSQAQHEALGYHKSKSCFIPNACDPAVFKPDAAARSALRSELGLPESTFLIGLVCRYHPMKDHANFLRAAALLAQSHPEVHFVLAGKDVDHHNQTLIQLRQELGISPQTHFLGERRDTPRLTAAFDIAASASAYGEGWPLVLTEAMACGVPCVVTDVGDSGWLVGDTGLVVPPQRPEALAAAWRSLVEADRVDRQTLGIAARERVVANFSLAAIVSRYETLYEQAA